jgi:hypothetical protein
MKKAAAKKSSTPTTPSLFLQILHHEVILVLALVLFAFTLRLKGIQNSVTDWHSFRQADTASVTREYVKHGVDLLHPKYHDNSNIQSGKDNPEGYRMVEFPFINAGTALVLRTFPQLDLVLFSRFVSIVFSLGTVVSLYYLGKKWSGQTVGLLAAFFFAVLPYSVYYSRVILPEPAFIFFSTFAILSFQNWLDETTSKRWAWLIGSAVALSLALLLKPFGLFLGFVFLVMLWRKYGLKSVLRLELILYALICLVPLYFWRKWILNYPQGIPASDWLFNGDGIRFRPAWFRWLFWERITKLITGFIGAGFLGLSLFRKEKAWFNYFAWWVGILAYFSVIATGNVRHDYYQVFITPILCLSLARGMVWVWEQRTKLPVSKELQNYSVLLALGLASAAMVYLSDLQVRGYYGTRADYEKAGQAADRLLPPDAKVIAPAFGDTAFLFQTNRTGWPIGFEIEDKIAKGAEYYVSTSYDDEAHALEKKYQVIAKTPDYIIIKLK